MGKIVFIVTTTLNCSNRFSRAEGCVAIVLKDLKTALRDGDHIYATVSLSYSHDYAHMY